MRVRLLSIDYVADPFAGRSWTKVCRRATYETAGRRMADGLYLGPVEYARMAGFSGSLAEPDFAEAAARGRAMVRLDAEQSRWAAAVVHAALRRLRSSSGRRGPETVMYDTGPLAVIAPVARADCDAVLDALRGIERGQFAAARLYLSLPGGREGDGEAGP